MGAIQYYGFRDPRMRYIGPDIVGEAKYMGLTLASNGFMYCCPYNYPRILKINPETAEVTELGPDYTGNAKWWGIVAHTNGKLYCAPNARASYLEIDPATDQSVEIASPYGAARGVAFHPDGNLYSWRSGSDVVGPMNQLISFNPVSGSITLVGQQDLTAAVGASFRGTILGKDNKVYNSVGNKRRIFRYDPSNGSVEVFNQENIGGNNSHWGMSVSKDNNNIYYANHIDGDVTTWYDMGTGIKQSATGYHVSQIGGGNSMAITPAPNGELFHAPAMDLFVNKHTVDNGNDSPFGFNLGLTANKYSGIKAAGNGKLYLAPYNMTRVLEIYSVGEFANFGEVYSFDSTTNEPTVYMRGL